MRWYVVFIKGIKEQIREYWILVLTLLMSPLFIAIYYLMGETEDPVYDVILVNQDRGCQSETEIFNLGDSIISYAEVLSLLPEMDMITVFVLGSREEALDKLRRQKADVVVILPGNLSRAVLNTTDSLPSTAGIELVGDITQMEYIIGAVWVEELINSYILEVAEIRMPVHWLETSLGFSGKRTYFELYVPGLLILSIIMIIFSASAAIVRESEARTLERLRISRLTAMEFLAGISLVQILVAILSLILALLTAIALGYSLIPGTLGFILLISVLTGISMISFSLLVAAMCRSVKEVAIIGTFPLFLLMFFTGAAFPVHGGKLFTLGGYQVMLNDLLSPKFSIEALNKVLVRGLEVRDTFPEILALLALTLFYSFVGTWAFKRRHMRAQ
jgi:ABC-2 type transport system permease protein